MKFSVNTATDGRQQIDVEVTDYKAAGEAGLSLTQHLQQKYPTLAAEDGTVMEQLMAQSNMFVSADVGTGLRPPTMKQVLDGGLDMNVGTVVRPDGTGNNTPSGRLLFPEIIMQLIQSELSTSNEDFLSGFDSMVAQTASVAGNRIEQPVINVTAPEASRNQPIAQLAEPAVMVNITVSDKTYKIPTKSIGLQISDEALQAATLDLVGLAMTAQARQERVEMVENHLTSMINGDVDLGETALTSITAQSLDALVVAAGKITQKAWIHYLRDDYRKIQISHIIADIDTALALEGRTGKPTNQNDDPNSPRIDSLFSIENLGLTPPKILLIDTALIGANTIVGLDSRYAIRKVINVNAAYSAIESYILRRTTAFRVDYGEISHKLYTDAWKKMTLTV